MVWYEIPDYTEKFKFIEKSVKIMLYKQHNPNEEMCEF